MAAIKNSSNLSLRPSRPSDQAFLEKLFNSTRDDLRMVNADNDFIEGLIEQQFQAQTQGYGNQFPNALYFIVERLGERIGKATIDFGHNEIHLLDIAFIPEARNKGFGKSVIQMIQSTAEQVKAPLTLSVFQQNLGARKFYHSLGFLIDSIKAPYERLVWYPRGFPHQQAGT